MSPGYAVLAWFHKRWVPAWQHDAVLRSRATIITLHNELSADYATTKERFAATMTTLTKETAARAQAEERLEHHMKLCDIVRATASQFRQPHDPLRRQLRLDLFVDDRMIYAMVDDPGHTTLRGYLAKEAAWKMEAAVQTIDFALAGSVMKERPR